MYISLWYFLVCETLLSIISVLLKQRNLHHRREGWGRNADRRDQSLYIPPSLPATESCRRLKLTYSWETWASFVGQLAQGILMASNFHTTYKSQRPPLDLLQLLLHLGSVCILVSSLPQPFQLHPYFLWHNFSPSDLSAHWIMSQKTQTNTGFTCVNPPSSPWPDASVAAGFGELEIKLFCMILEL